MISMLVPNFKITHLMGFGIVLFYFVGGMTSSVG
jgi:hypothetical protein